MKDADALAHVNQASSAGNTALHFAAVQQHWSCLRAVIRMGADVNAQNDVRGVLYAVCGDCSALTVLHACNRMETRRCTLLRVLGTYLSFAGCSKSVPSTASATTTAIRRCLPRTRWIDGRSCSCCTSMGRTLLYVTSRLWQLAVRGGLTHLGVVSRAPQSKRRRTADAWSTVQAHVPALSSGIGVHGTATSNGHANGDGHVRDIRYGSDSGSGSGGGGRGSGSGAAVRNGHSSGSGRGSGSGVAVTNGHSSGSGSGSGSGGSGSGIGSGSGVAVRNGHSSGSGRGSGSGSGSGVAVTNGAQHRRA